MKALIVLTTALAVLITVFFWFAIPLVKNAFFSTTSEPTAQEETPAEESAPEYILENFPATESFIGTPALPDFESRPEARLFRTVITDGAALGPNFAGAYTVVSWGCGTSCQTSAILSAETGKIIAYDIFTGLGSEFRLDSRLLIANPQENRAPELNGDTPTNYYELTGGQLVFAAKLSPGEEAPTPCEQVLVRAQDPTTQEIREFTTTCDVPSSWEVLQ